MPPSTRSRGNGSAHFHRSKLQSRAVPSAPPHLTQSVRCEPNHICSSATAGCSPPITKLHAFPFPPLLRTTCGKRRYQFICRDETNYLYHQILWIFPKLFPHLKTIATLISVLNVMSADIVALLKHCNMHCFCLCFYDVAVTVIHDVALFGFLQTCCCAL